MSVFKRVLAGLTLSASFLVATGARAMPIPQFDKLADTQKGQYAVFLVESAANILAAQGDTAGAAKVRDLFENDPGKPAKPGVDQFYRNLNAIRKINQDNSADPNFKPFEVEHALSLTLKNNGIFVPPSKLLLASQNYHPTPPSGSLAVKTRPKSPSIPGGQ